MSKTIFVSFKWNLLKDYFLGGMSRRRRNVWTYPSLKKLVYLSLCLPNLVHVSLVFLSDFLFLYIFFIVFGLSLVMSA